MAQRLLFAACSLQLLGIFLFVYGSVMLTISQWRALAAGSLDDVGGTDPVRFLQRSA